MFQLFLIHLCIRIDLHCFLLLWAFLTTPAFQGGTLGALTSVKTWRYKYIYISLSQLPTPQAGQRSLVVKEKIAAKELSPSRSKRKLQQGALTFHWWDRQQAALALQLLLHPHGSPRQASSWLNHSWTNCFTPRVPNSSLCVALTVSQNHRITEWLGLEGTSGGHLVQPPCWSRVTQSRRSVAGILTGLMLSLVAVALGCVWFVGVLLQIQVSSDLAVKPDIVEASWHCPALQNPLHKIRVRVIPSAPKI